MNKGENEGGGEQRGKNYAKERGGGEKIHFIIYHLSTSNCS
jgi:hypothetical protein